MYVADEFGNLRARVDASLYATPLQDPLEYQVMEDLERKNAMLAYEFQGLNYQTEDLFAQVRANYGIATPTLLRPELMREIAKADDSMSKNMASFTESRVNTGNTLLEMERARLNRSRRSTQLKMRSLQRDVLYERLQARQNFSRDLNATQMRIDRWTAEREASATERLPIKPFIDDKKQDIPEEEPIVEEVTAVEDINDVVAEEKDKRLGVYEILVETVVTKAEERFSDRIDEKLLVGKRVDVVEMIEFSDRIRGRLDIGGWISIESTCENHWVWAKKIRDADATRDFQTEEMNEMTSELQARREEDKEVVKIEMSGDDMKAFE